MIVLLDVVLGAKNMANVDSCYALEESMGLPVLLFDNLAAGVVIEYKKNKSNTGDVRCRVLRSGVCKRTQVDALLQ